MVKRRSFKGWWKNLEYWKKGGIIGFCFGLLGLLGIFGFLFKQVNFFNFINFIPVIINYIILLIFVDPNEAFFIAITFAAVLSPFYYSLIGILIGIIIKKVKSRGRL